MSNEQTHVRVILKNSCMANGVKLECNTLLLYAELPKGVSAAHVTDAINRGNVNAFGARALGAVSPVVIKDGKRREPAADGPKVLEVPEPLHNMKKVELQAVATHFGLETGGTNPEILDRIIELLDAHQEETGEDLVVLVDSVTAPE